jgi:hypothetical protein
LLQKLQIKNNSKKARHKDTCFQVLLKLISRFTG